MLSSTSRIASRSVLRGNLLPPAICRCVYARCPIWSDRKPFQRTPIQSRSFTQTSRLSQTQTTDTTTKSNDALRVQAAAVLPVSCPGCGAFAQWIEPEEPGYYNLNRGAVKKFVNRALARARQSGSGNPTVDESSGAAATTDGSEALTSPSEAGEAAQAGPEQDTVPEQAKGEATSTLSRDEVQAEPTQDSMPEHETGEATSIATEEVTQPGPKEDIIPEKTAEEATKTPVEKLAPSSEIEQGARSTAEDSSTETKSSQTTTAQDIATETTALAPPLCERCHLIVNHNEFRPIAYPPITYVQSVMDESPWDHNHVYHIVDAADFPLSMISRIYRYLDVQKQRSRNRRSKVTQYSSSERLADLHFIITRSDLLGPTKEKVDALMKDVLEVLRDALGSTGERVRLGNVNMVSANKGWWTKTIKEKIWKEGGAVWMFGKTNVGKSKLIETVFPKSAGLFAKRKGTLEPAPGQMNIEELDSNDPDALLPPPQKVDGYPVLPLVSAAPGTTASPIRIPFGGNRGEVIDLPGLFRTGLSEFVKDQYKTDLIMNKRPKPNRLSIKPGQSLLLDRLIRITSLDPDVVILAAPFVPLHPHVTSTEKAIQIESGKRVYRPFIPDEHYKKKDLSIAKDDVGRKMASAGVFPLQWDVTHTYGEERDKDNDRPLLYRMLAVDVLIEGSGWVELVCQIRKRNRAPDDFPKVEVFSPEGKFVGVRKSLRTYAFVEEMKKKSRKKQKGRWS